MYKNILTKAGVFSLSLFATASAVYLYSPVIGSHADESANLTVNTEVNPIISVTLDASELVFNITPTASGVFESKPLTANVSTNSSNGYELYFSAINDSTDMVSPTNNDVIASDFDGSVTSSSMAANKWGYSLNDTDFSKIPTLTNHATIRNIDHHPSAAERVTTVYVGTKISSALKSGTYAKDVVFSAIAHMPSNSNNGDCTTGFFCLENMQDMTSEICDATTTPLATASEIDWDGSHAGDTNYIPRTTLKDTRDNNTYLVSKFADGACWMSQNLELELSTTKALTNADTDLNSKSSWTPDHNTSNNTSVFFVGDWYSYSLSTDKGISARKSTQYLRGGKTASATPTTNDGKSEWEKVGVYYDLDAATAGSDDAIFATYDIDNYSFPEGQDLHAPDSICPKGWKLPSDSSEAIGGAQRFVDTYSYTRTFDELSGFTATGKIRNTQSDEEYYNYFGEYGYWWTNTITDGYYLAGYHLYADSNSDSYNMGLSGWDGAYRHQGAQVRCVAR